MRYWTLAALIALIQPSWAGPATNKASTSGVADGASCSPSIFITPSETKTFRDCHATTQMIPLRGGSFAMGDEVGDGQPFEQPVHQVSVAAFALGRFEVSIAEWDLCVAASRCTAAELPSHDGKADYPVVGVSWEQATTYGQWLSSVTGKSYRLPSEAEWEYAARAGETGKFPWAPGEDVCKQVNLLDRSGRTMHPEWYWAEGCDDQYADSAPVGSFPPNVWGFNDMLGNVWEWVEDCWHSDFTDAPSDSRAWEADGCRKRVNRGGGWGNNVRSLRLSNRDADRSTSRSDGLGFRIARDLSADELKRFGSLAPDATVVAIHLPTAPASPSGPGTDRSNKVIIKEAPASPMPVVARERDLSIHITIHGEQNWQKLPEHSVASTTQEMTISTRLHSDGVLYRENLLDLDPTIRFAVKEQYIARQGLLQIQALNGGTLPRTREELDRLASQIEATLTGCLADAQCAGEAVYRAAGVDALRRYSERDLAEAVGPPATGAAARWLYYFGYSNCPAHVQASNKTHIDGVRAVFVNGSRVEPWIVDQMGSGPVAADDVQRLCARYTVTADNRTGDVYVENVYLPGMPGTTVETRGSRVTRDTHGLSLPPEVITWVNAKLRKSREALDLNEDLVSHAPFDGNYTVLGHFEGTISAKLEWSFKPAPAMAASPTLPAK